MWIKLTTKYRGTTLINLALVQTVEAPPPTARGDRPIARFAFQQNSSECVEVEFSSLKLRDAVVDSVAGSLRVVTVLTGAS